MTLGEFISYCTLTGYVVEHKELDKPAWDANAEKYVGLRLQGRGYTATIQYATMGDGAAITRCSLFDSRSHGTKIITQPSLGDIVEAFIPK